MVCAALAREAGYSVVALTIDYKQRHRVELEAAKAIAAQLADRHIVLPLDLRAFGGSALTSDIAVPKDGVGEGIPVTYVPARNTIFLSLALGLAEASGASDIFIGVNALDYSGYPDCRPAFVAGLSHSCYDPSPDGRACGACDACRLRAKGFAEAGIADPTVYA
jgi:7-cyano-7-deazaguanine synthase